MIIYIIVYLKLRWCFEKGSSAGSATYGILLNVWKDLLVYNFINCVLQPVSSVSKTNIKFVFFLIWVDDAF